MGQDHVVSYTKKLLKIELETDGSAEGTLIRVNGVPQMRLLEWAISIRKQRGKSMTPITISGIRAGDVVNGKALSEPFSWYGPAAVEKLTAEAARIDPGDLIGCATAHQEK
jgi:hypothetical protein